jgi:phosphate/sulfate permease
MATSVATGALKPKVAVIIAAVLNVIGACLSTEVALVKSNANAVTTTMTTINRVELMQDPSCGP